MVNLVILYSLKELKKVVNKTAFYSLLSDGIIFYRATHSQTVFLKQNRVVRLLGNLKFGEN